MDLTPEQKAEAQQLYEAFQGAFLEEARRLAELLASKADAQLLGRTEFEVRDGVHRLGATALQAALEERKKGLPRLQHDLPPLPGRRPLQGLVPAPRLDPVGRGPLPPPLLPLPG